jgi:hypothetical protein
LDLPPSRRLIVFLEAFRTDAVADGKVAGRIYEDAASALSALR